MTQLASPIERGHEALKRADWEEARHCFESALGSAETAEAYEGLSWTAWWLNDADTLFQARESAYRLYRDAKDDLGAARMAMWIASDYTDFRGELPIANGWRQRAHRLIETLPTAAEHGWYWIIQGDAALLVEDDSAKAKECAIQAIAIGRQLGEPDIEMIGLAMEGIALVSEGAIDEGMKRLDEAVVFALGGELREHFSACWSLCYLIYACERVRDFDRAVQWCQTMREHADRLQITLMQGICRAHYASVLIWRGKWDEAESELSDATEKLQASRPPAVAESMVRLADLRRRQGRIEEAAEIFQQIEWHPMALFGLAEIALDSGRPRDALDLAARALRQIPESNRLQRASAYELLVRAEVLLGNHSRATEAFAAVQALSDAVPTLPLRAATRFSAGSIAVFERDYEQARAGFEDAVALFERSAAPYESARARLELASVLVSLDRLDRAEAEARLAFDTLDRLDSTFHAARAAALLADIERRRSGGQLEQPASSALTERQIEILRLISRGLNDREIAAALVVSEHTVHRHVANILQRLDLPSRAAAVAYASAQGLI